MGIQIPQTVDIACSAGLIAVTTADQLKRAQKKSTLMQLKRKFKSESKQLCRLKLIGSDIQKGNSNLVAARSASFRSRLKMSLRHRLQTRQKGHLQATLTSLLQTRRKRLLQSRQMRLFQSRQRRLFQSRQKRLLQTRPKRFLRDRRSNTPSNTYKPGRQRPKTAYAASIRPECILQHRRLRVSR